MKRIFKFISFLLIFLISIYFIGNQLICSHKIKRFQIQGNPNFEIIMETKNCGATTSFVSEVYIVNKGNNISFLQKPFLKFSNDNINLVFIKKNTIQINIGGSFIKVYDFHNYTYLNGRMYKFILTNQ